MKNPFRRKQIDTNATPTEITEYYTSERRDRRGATWLVGVGVFIATVLIVLGLFYGGRAIYRALTDDTPADQTTEQTTEQGTSTSDGAQSPSTPPSTDSNTQGNGTDEAPATAPVPAPSPNSGDTEVSPEATPSTGPTADEIPQTGPSIDL